MAAHRRTRAEGKHIVDTVDFCIGRIAAYAKERDARVIVVFVPVYNYPDRLKPAPDDLAEVLNKHGATTIDMAEKFNATPGADPDRQRQSSGVVPCSPPPPRRTTTLVQPVNPARQGKSSNGDVLGAYFLQLWP